MYTELHLHTAYSLQDGASQPVELVLRAAELGYEALAITDHDSLSGAYEFAQACRDASIQPITGAEITLADGSHLTLLAETRAGYGNLCRLITDAKHGRLPAPAHQPEGADANWHTTSLADYAQGLILLTGCRQGELCRLLDAGDSAAAEAVLRTYVAWFGRDNVFVELQHNLVAGDRRRVRGLIALAETVDLSYVATGDVHCHKPERAYL